MSVDALAFAVAGPDVAALSDATAGFSGNGAASVAGPVLQAAAAAVAALAPLPASAVILVPAPHWIAPLKQALFERLRVHGRAWLPPTVETLDGLAGACLPVARVRNREARLLALASVLGEGGWSGRLQRAGALLDPIDAIARTLACEWLAGGAWGEAPGWDEALVLERIAASAAGHAGGVGAALSAQWQAIARYGGEVATRDDPVQVAARQWQALGRRWRDTRPNLIRIGLWPLRHDCDDGPADGVEPADQVLRALLTAAPELRLFDRFPARESLAGGPAGILVRAWPEVACGRPPAGEPDWPAIGRRVQGAAADRDRVAAAILHAIDREDESMRAARWVHQTLLAGARSVAIVVLDRWLARRVRALLERAAILIDDREGWALSTTVAATWPMAWLELCALAPAGEQLPEHGGGAIALASLLDSAFTRHPLATGLARLLRQRALGERVEAAPAVLALERELLALIRAQRAATTPAAQASGVRDAMRVLAAEPALAADEAGRQVIAMVDRIGAMPFTAASGQVRRCDHDAFRALLGFFLERQRFHDSAIVSPVQMTGLEAAALQAFDAVLVLGANAAQFPAAVPAAPGFIDAMLPALGMTSAAAQRHAQVVALACLLQATPRWALSCRSDSHDGSLPSPLLERLAAVAAVDLGALREAGAIDWRTVDESAAGGGDRHPMPRPAEPARLPDALTVSAIDRLIQCPFRFLVNDVWRLSEPREHEDEPGKRELGIIVHATLLQFHHEVDDPARHDDAALIDRLLAVTERVLAAQTALRPARLVHVREWRAVAARYVAHFRADHAAGWRFVRGEQRAEQTVVLPSGHALRLHGKFDRLDRRRAADAMVPADAAVEAVAAADAAADAVMAVGDDVTGPGGEIRRVVDYKLRNPGEVARQAKDIDRSAQLLLYAWFTGADEAVYLAIDRHDAKPCAVTPAPREVLPAWQQQLLAVLDRIDRGAALRALGDGCEYCSARGVCRQGHWRDDAHELASGQVAEPALDRSGP